MKNKGMWKNIKLNRKVPAQAVVNMRNFSKDKEGRYPFPHLICDVCGSLPNVAVKVEAGSSRFDVPKYVVICKGCACGMVDAMSKIMLEHVSKSKKGQ